MAYELNIEFCHDEVEHINQILAKQSKPRKTRFIKHRFKFDKDTIATIYVINNIDRPYVQPVLNHKGIQHQLSPRFQFLGKYVWNLGDKAYSLNIKTLEVNQLHGFIALGVVILAAILIAAYNVMA